MSFGSAEGNLCCAGFGGSVQAGDCWPPTNRDERSRCMLASGLSRRHIERRRLPRNLFFIDFACRRLETYERRHIHHFVALAAAACTARKASCAPANRRKGSPVSEACSALRRRRLQASLAGLPRSPRKKCATLSPLHLPLRRRVAGHAVWARRTVPAASDAPVPPTERPGSPSDSGAKPKHRCMLRPR
ncbi:hypothetical protein TGCAST_264830B [Toxoplasma gondii CAST]|uniref:Uncharacterized protein n=1 Tax=Toxoplasma gondii CAST TaxID=943122 RepID=A0A425I546_TOXGO|nr:hypothetical protein TGCAST_264830B [Toxoplasma gondii CAST]